MTVIDDLRRQLVQRRLWPLALGLLAALVAVPFVLARDPEPVAPAPAAPNAPGATEGPAKSIVTVADAQTAEPVDTRKVLGARKNPFKPAPGGVAKKKVVRPPTPARTASARSAPSATTAPGGGGGGDGGSASAPDLGAPSVAPSPVAPTARPHRRPHRPGELTLRFGDGGGGSRMRAMPGEPLPADTTTGEAPAVLIYLGPVDGGTRAEFLLEAGVTAQGDGECLPGPANCERIRLREGETEFFDVGDTESGGGAQFQLDVLDVQAAKAGARAAARRTASAEVARVRGSATGTAAVMGIR